MVIIGMDSTSTYFNSQPHKEADVDGRLKDDNLKTFQLTASQGG